MRRRPDSFSSSPLSEKSCMRSTTLSGGCRLSLFAVNAAALALSFLFVATPGAAQNTTGTIRGAVTGTNGAAVSDAQIAARNVETGVSRGTTSHADGSYVLAGLVPGTYDLSVRRIGTTSQ